MNEWYEWWIDKLANDGEFVTRMSPMEIARAAFAAGYQLAEYLEDPNNAMSPEWLA